MTGISWTTGRMPAPVRRTSPVGHRCAARGTAHRYLDAGAISEGRSANLSGMPSPRSPGARRRRVRSLGGRSIALLLGVPGVLLLLAGPAAAQGDIGDAHSPDPQSLPVMIGLYVGIPALFFLIAILLSLRSGRKSDRYRPGRPWEHDPAWFGSSVEESDEAQEQRRRAALPGAGGASGRW